MDSNVEDYEQYVNDQLHLDDQEPIKGPSIIWLPVIGIAILAAVIGVAYLMSKMSDSCPCDDLASNDAFPTKSGSVHFERISQDAGPAPKMHPVIATRQVTVNYVQQIGRSPIVPVTAGTQCTIHPGGKLVEEPTSGGPQQAYYIAEQPGSLRPDECEHFMVFDLPQQ